MSPVPLLLLACLLAAGCGPAPAPDAGAEAPRAPLAERARGVSRLHLLTFNRLQGFGAGYPCDPTTGSPLAKAATLADRIEQDGDRALLLAVGDTTARKRFVPADRTQAASVRARRRVGLAALAAAGVDLVAPGHADLMYGIGPFLRECEEVGLRVLLTNAHLAREGLEPSVVVEHGGVRYGFLAVVPTFIPDDEGNPIEVEFDDLEIDEPLERARQESARLLEEEGVDFVVCLSNVQAKMNRAVAKVPTVHLVVGGAEATPADGVIFDPGVSTALMVSSEISGQELGHTTLEVHDGSLAFADVSGLHTLPVRIAEDTARLARLVEEHGTDDLETLARYTSPQDPEAFLHWASMIDENRAALETIAAYEGSSIAHRAAALGSVSEAPEVLAALDELPATLEHVFANLDMPDEPFIKHTRLSPPYAKDCRGCHAAQYAHWEGTSHANAFERVASRGLARDVTCLRCHTTAFNEPGGYTDLRERAPYGSVQCYACHGTNQVHADSALRVVDPGYHFWRTAEDMQCLRCHREERSPGFDRAAATAAIACPPIDHRAAEIVAAYEEVLARCRERRVRGEDAARDPYFEARALLGLGRTEEGLAILRDFAPRVRTDPLMTIELARLFEQAGDSHGALALLRDVIEVQTGEPNTNREYVRLLLEASDESARDPEAALRRIRFLLPEDGPTGDLTLRLYEIDALFALGRTADAVALVNRLFVDYGHDPAFLERIDRYGLRKVR